MAAVTVRETLQARLAIVVVLAGTLALADLALKAAVPTAPANFHERSQGWIVLSVVLLLAALALARVPSRTVAIGAGVLGGGVAGNLLSARWNDNRVPNPLVLGDHVAGVAFNAADLFVLAGNLLLVVSLVVVSIRNRHLLLPPREWEAAVRRRLRPD